MVFKFFSNIKNYAKGVTLIELILVIFVATVFSLIIIANFPRILRQAALSRVTYKLAQDMRRVEDLGLSGVQLNDSGSKAIMAKGYGIYINTSSSTKQYVIYADVAGPADVNGVRTSDKKYNGDLTYPLCENVAQSAPYDRTVDCVIEVVDVGKENPSLSIKSITNDTGYTSYSNVSANFTPPDPTVTITTNNVDPNALTLLITLQNTDGVTRQVLVNKSGLIDIVK